jgi:hypothetical protein
LNSAPALITRSCIQLCKQPVAQGVTLHDVPAQFSSRIPFQREGSGDARLHPHAVFGLVYSSAQGIEVTEGQKAGGV